MDDKNIVDFAVAMSTLPAKYGIACIDIGSVIFVALLGMTYLLEKYLEIKLIFIVTSTDIQPVRK